MTGCVVGYSPGSPLYASLAHLLSRAVGVPPLSLVASWAVADPVGSGGVDAVTHADLLPDGSLVVGHVRCGTCDPACCVQGAECRVL